MQYDLVRSKRKRISIQIKDGKLIVRAPLKETISRIESFLERHSNWISRKLNDSAKRVEMYADVLSGDRFMFLGKDLTVECIATSRFSIREGFLNIPARYFDNGALKKSEELYDALKRLYKREAKKYLESRLGETSSEIGLSYSRFDLTSGKTKWGSCDGKNSIRLNWHLVMLDESIVNYVIIHELAHTVEHNHSSRFWSIVAKYYPDYKEAKACLKNASVIIGLWC